MERRRYVRHAVEMTFWVLNDDGASLLMKSVNISAGGAFLQPEEGHRDLPAVGGRVRFSVIALDDNPIPDDVDTGEVVRATPDGIALQFME